MAVLPIITYPNPLLREKCKEIAFDNPSEIESLKALVEDLKECIVAYNGIGIAAPQVGVLKRLIVLDVPIRKFDQNGEEIALEENENEKYISRVLLNPHIISASQETWKYLEGCLSIPDVLNKVERPRKITFSYQNFEGETITEEAENLYATAVQHEIDHLNGTLFIDHLSKLKRDRLLKKYEKYQMIEKAHHQKEITE